MLRKQPTQPRAPVLAAVFVLNAAYILLNPPFNALPPLNPNHPNQINTVPRNTSVVLCGFLNFSTFVFLLPSTKAYANALQPLATCTGPPPAKSRLGRLYSQPLGFHVQHAMGQYTTVAQKKPKTSDGRIRPRSNAPPTTICTVQAQNSS
jgi:hypothetical protein